MDPNELVVILDRAIANLPDPSADGRRRVYERVERTIRATCTPEGGEMDMERYQALRRDLGAAIAIIEQQRRSPAPPPKRVITASAPTAVATPPPPPPPPSQSLSTPREPVAADESPEEEGEDGGASPVWLKRLGIGAAVTAVTLGIVIAALPGGPLRSLLAGSNTAPKSQATAEAPKPVDPFAGAQPPPAPVPDSSPSIGDGIVADIPAFAPTPSTPGVPRVTDVKVSIMNGASEWRTEPLKGFESVGSPVVTPVMAVAQDRETPLLVSLYCDTPDLTVFRVAYGSDPATLRQEIGERGSMDGVQRQRIQIKTDRNEGFAGDFLALTAHTWGIRMAPENIETLRTGKEIEISIGDSVAGTVSLSGATPAIDEALAGGSCT